MISQKPRLYQQKEETFFNDGREEHLLSYVRSQIKNSQAGTKELIDLIDDYGVTQSYLMNIGIGKGEIVTSLIAQHRPKVMVELGSYIGYSTLLFADALKKNGGSRYISFERNPKFASIAKSFVEMTGLSDIVEFVIGPSSENLVNAQAMGSLLDVDMIFLDHYKPSYLRDIQICESLGLIKEGTVLVADNVISPGNPPYLEYVRGSESDRTRVCSQVPDISRFPGRAATQYGDELEGVRLPGVPKISYDSSIVESYEPTGEKDGIEVSVCKSVPLEVIN